MSRTWCLFASLAVLFAARFASSAVVERMSLEQLSRAADLVVIGTVISSKSRYDDIRPDRIVTDFVVRVVRVVLGEPKDEVVVTTPGGVVDGQGQIVPGGPVLRVGEEVVLFLRSASPAKCSTIARPRFAIVGLSQGLFVVQRERPEGPARARQRLSGVYIVGHGPAIEMEFDLEEIVRAVKAFAPHGTAQDRDLGVTP